MGSSTENSAFGPTLQPVGPRARARRLVGRLGGRRGRRPRAVGDRHRHRRLDPPARRAVRDRRPQAHLRRDLALRHDRLRLLARPGRPVHARRDGRRAAARRDGGPGPVRLDVARPPRAGAAARRAPTSRGVRLGVPEELSGEGIEPGVLRRLRGDARPRPRARRGGRAVPPPARPARARRLLPDRARRGLLEPRALRRRPLRPPRGRRATTCCTCTRETRERGFGAEVKRRIMLGTYALSSGYYDAYYGRAQKVRTLIAAGLQGRLGAVRLHRHADEPDASPSSSARRLDDPLAMYLNDFLTVPMSLAGIPAISLPCGLSEGLPVGFQLAGPGVQRERAARRRARAGAARSASTPHPGGGRHELAGSP